ncbi:MAG: hypothetical protein PVI06_03525 [Desulfobacterales bacterium]
MKFYITEKNIGDDTTRGQAEKVIELLKDKGWDVEYGMGKNKPTDISEFGREEKIYQAFADDFMICISQLESDIQREKQ